MSQFHTRRMLEDRWTDAPGVTGFLNAYGYSIRREAVGQWFARDRVPGEWGFLLLALHEAETGQPLSLVKYLG